MFSEMLILQLSCRNNVLLTHLLSHCPFVGSEARRPEVMPFEACTGPKYRGRRRLTHVYCRYHSNRRAAPLLITISSRHRAAPVVAHIVADSQSPALML